MNQSNRSLAMRRQLLVMKIQLQRLQWRQDTGALAAQSTPLALVAGLGGGPAAHPLLSLAAALAVSLWQRWAGGRSR